MYKDLSLGMDCIYTLYDHKMLEIEDNCLTFTINHLC